MSIRFYIKEDKWKDFRENHDKYGFNRGRNGNYYKYVGNKRELVVYDYNREITDLRIDFTTYTGYMYESEYRHRTKTYIGDLIKDGYIEAKGVKK